MSRDPEHDSRKRRHRSSRMSHSLSVQRASVIGFVRRFETIKKRTENNNEEQINHHRYTIIPLSIAGFEQLFQNPQLSRQRNKIQYRKKDDASSSFIVLARCNCCIDATISGGLLCFGYSTTAPNSNDRDFVYRVVGYLHSWAIFLQEPKRR